MITEWSSSSEFPCTEASLAVSSIQMGFWNKLRLLLLFKHLFDVRASLLENTTGVWQLDKYGKFHISRVHCITKYFLLVFSSFISGDILFVFLIPPL